VSWRDLLAPPQTKRKPDNKKKERNKKGDCMGILERCALLNGEACGPRKTIIRDNNSTKLQRGSVNIVSVPIDRVENRRERAFT